MIGRSRGISMKNLHLQRWSGAFLSPQTRPSYLHHQLALNLRRQSTATSLLPQTLPDDPSPQLEELDLRSLPSAPPSHASSSAKLSALHARLVLPPRLPVETLARCLIDPSADPHPSFNNGSLSILGNDLLGYYTSEAIICRYPRLPTAVLFAAMAAYCGPKALAAVTREWGVEVAAEPGGEVDMGYLQCKRMDAGNAEVDGTGLEVKEIGKFPNPREGRGWKRGMSSKTMLDVAYFGSETDTRRTKADYDERPNLKNEDSLRNAAKPVTLEDASTRFVRAVMGAVYLHGGRRAAKFFFSEHIMSRHLDVSKIFEFRQPTRDLSKLCAREGFKSPIARILSETGRLTRHPVFVVGVFSGKDKLGEGTGASLDEARIRASVAALKGWYLYTPLEVKVPSDVEGEGKKPWKPVLVDGGEVIV